MELWMINDNEWVLTGKFLGLTPPLKILNDLCH